MPDLRRALVGNRFDPRVLAVWLVIVRIAMDTSSWRLVPYAWIAIAAIAWLAVRRLRRLGVAIGAAVILVALQHSPIDVVPWSVPGGPRLVDVTWGIACDQDARERGEIACGGCVVDPDAPDRVLAW